MTAGIPGTGIGGLFYVLLVLLMPVREAWRTARGRSSAARWRTLAGQWALAAGIVAALGAEAWLLKRGLLWVLAHAPADSAVFRTCRAATAAVVPALAVVPFAILAGLLGALHVLRVLVRWRERGRTAGQPPTPHRADLPEQSLAAR